MKTSKSIQLNLGPWLSLFLAAGFIAGCQKEVMLKYSTDRPLSAEACAPCHEEIYRVWRASSHAKAWIRDAYQDSLSSTGTRACFGCHAPSVPAGSMEKKPAVRESNLLEGVNCAGCHAAGCPKVHLVGFALVRDPVELQDPYTRSIRCGRCHRGTLDEWRGFASRFGDGEDPPSCTSCHMSGRDGFGEDGGLNTLPAAAGGTDGYGGHHFAAPDKDVIEVELVRFVVDDRGEHEVELALHNHRAGHGVPTGDYGHREVRIEVTLEGAGAVPVFRERCFVEMGNALQPGANGPYRFSVSSPVKELHVRVVRVDRTGKVLRELGRRDWTVGTGEEKR